jgi:hypothetical protein
MNEHSPTQETPPLGYQATVRVEVTLILSGTDAQEVDAAASRIRLVAVDEQGQALPAVGPSGVSLECGALAHGFVREGTAEREGAQPRGRHARWVAHQQLEDPSDRFFAWLEDHEVDSLSDTCFRDETIEQHGFPLPEREADAIWYLPEPEDAYPVGAMQCEWWQEEGKDGKTEVLGFKISTDPVMGMEHVTWYRIPQSAIALLMGEDAPIARGAGGGEENCDTLPTPTGQRVVG